MSILTYIKSHAVLAGTLAFVAVAGTIIAGRVADQKGTGEISDGNVKRVALIDAASFRSGTSTVSADGIVESVSQVDLKSQVSAPVSSVWVALGNWVNKGQTIAELENADIRAQLEQAKISLSLEGVSTGSAKQAAIDAIRDAYLKADDAVHTQMEYFLFDNGSGSPSLMSLLSDTALADKIRTGYIDQKAFWPAWRSSVESLSNNSSDASISAALALSKKDVAAIASLVDNVSVALNQISNNSSSAVSATVTGWKATVTAARNSVSGTASALTSADRAFTSSLVTGGASVQTSTSIAEAGMKSLEAQLARTVITAPISGTIAALPLRVGELAAPGQLIATIVGPGGLQVKAYASGEDLFRIKVGAIATIHGRISGTVMSVAPSVSATNKKAEVIVRVGDSAATDLVVGENVQVRIQAERATSNGVTATGYSLPIQNIKIEPGAAYVFTVDAESKIVRNPVILGKVSGDFIEVVSGLTDDMKIVSPVYELEAGQEVAVE